MNAFFFEMYNLKGVDLMKIGNKIAIITDIHGNYSALKAVLDDIDKDKEIQQIYCLGDLIAIGHETNEVLELLFSRNDISYVKGNHDEAIMNLVDGKEPQSIGEERLHHQWISSRLHPKYIPRLKNIPIKQTANIGGKHFLFIHYHLNEHQKFLPIDNDPSLHKLNNIYELMDVDVICFGHHHQIHHFKSIEKLYINPGSLGCNNKPIASYAKLQVGNSGQINVLFMEVPYDNKEFLCSYEKLNVPAKESILKIFFGNQQLSYSTE